MTAEQTAADVDILKGVAYNPPPTASMLREATRVAESIGAFLGPKGGIVGVKTDAGVNGAIVLPLADGKVKIAGWIGKQWGTTVKGGMFILNF